jgi:hypothetical protein
MPLEQMYSVRKIAERWGRDYDTIHAWVKCGCLRAVNLGTGAKRSWGIPESALEQFIDAGGHSIERCRRGLRLKRRTRR